MTALFHHPIGLKLICLSAVFFVSLYGELALGQVSGPGGGTGGTGEYTKTWKGEFDSFWGSFGAWTDDNVSASDPKLIFGNVISNRYSTTNNTGSGSAYTGIQFSSTANAYTLGQDAIKLGNASTSGSIVVTVDPTSSLTHTINLGMELVNPNAASITTTANGNISVSGAISGSGGITKTGNGTLTLSGINSYSGVTTVVGGTFSVSSLANGGSNSGIGSSSNAAANLVIDGGTLQYTGPAVSTDRQFTLGTSGGTVDASGTGALTLSSTTAPSLSGSNTSRTLTLTGSSTANNTLAAPLGDNGSGATLLTKTGAGTWVLSGNNTYTGATTISDGTLSVTGSLSNSTNVDVGASGVYNVAATDTINGLSGGGSVNLNSNTLTVGGNNGGGTFTGSISGLGGFTKEGSGTQVLSGTNTYSGATTISNGTLTVSGSLSNSTNVDVGASGVYNVAASDTINALTGSGSVNLNSNTLTVGGNNGGGTFSGALSGSGNFTKEGSGTQVLSGTNTYTGATTISNGTLTVSGSLSNSTNVDVAASGVYNVAASDSINALTGSGSVTLNSNTLTVGGNNGGGTFAGSISGLGGFTKEGSGIQVLSGTNTYTGATTISNGTLTVSGSLSNSSDVNVGASGFYNLAASDTINGLTGSGSVSLNSNTLTVGGNNGGGTFSGALAGSGNFTKEGSGTQLLSGTNTYTGVTTISNGTLTVSGSLSNSTNVDVGASGVYNVAASDTINALTGGGSVNLNSNTLTVGGNNGGGTFTGSISGLGGFTKVGSGTQVLSGVNSFAGLTTVTAGVLNVTGSIAGNVSVASGATLNGTGGTFSGINTINGTLTGSGTYSGNTTINGIHSPGNSPGFQSFGGDLTYTNNSSFTWELFANSSAGRGTNYDAVDVGGNLLFTGATSMNLVFGGTVDWTNTFWGSNQSWTIFDLTTPGRSVTGLNFFTISGNNWNDAFGNSLSTARAGSSFSLSQSGSDVILQYNSGSGSQAVPEPSSLALMGVAGLLGGGRMLRRYIRRRKEAVANS